MLVSGTKCYGKIARVPRTLYIATQFVHVCFMPLFPVRSFVIRSGSEVSDGFFGGTFYGKAIPLHTKSVLAAYLRWWIGVPTAIMAAASVLATGAFVRAATDVMAWRVAAQLAYLGLLVVPFALSMQIPGTRGYWFQGFVHLVSLVAGLVYWAVTAQEPNVAALPPAVDVPAPPLLLLNIGLAVYGLLRPFDFANESDKAELIRTIGKDPEDDEDAGWELAE